MTPILELRYVRLRDEFDPVGHSQIRVLQFRTSHHIAGDINFTEWQAVPTVLEADAYPKENAK